MPALKVFFDVTDALKLRQNLPIQPVELCPNLNCCSRNPTLQTKVFQSSMSSDRDCGPPNPMSLLNDRILALAMAGGLSLLAGCSLTGQHKLEAGLRQSEISIRQLEQELATAKQQLHDQEDELQALKTSTIESPFHSASSSRTPEAAVAWGAVNQLRIHSLTSGILRTDDGGLMVNLIVQPLDRDGEVVKVAGELSIQLQRPGKTTLLTETTVTPLESRSAWTNGMIARGFQVELPLPNAADASLVPDGKVLATATLHLGHDRQFEAAHLIRVPK